MFNISYKIEIEMNPDRRNMVSGEHCWMVLKKDNTMENAEWKNDGLGWARDSEQAWDEAYKCYKEIIKRNLKESGHCY
jgi:hypothetical protein